MYMHGEKIRQFTDLIAWQEAHALAIEVYNVTRGFPSDEKFGLVSQMRRCVVSVGSNIAEGFGRRTLTEKTRFYDIAIGSLFELQSQLLLSKELSFLKFDDHQHLYERTRTTNRLLVGLIKSIR